MVRGLLVRELEFGRGAEHLSIWLTHRKGPETTQKYGKSFEFKFPWETLVT